MSVGFLGIGLMLWGALGAVVGLLGNHDGGATSLNVCIRCGLGGIAAAIGFGMAQIANDVRYRVVPSLTHGLPGAMSGRSRHSR